MAKESPRLGVLGGMGPQATQIFYQRILDRTEAECDQEHLPALIFSDTEMPDRTKAILSGQGETVYLRLLKNARLLESCGCTAIAIPCNTSHYFLDRLQAGVNTPILHMVRETAKAVHQRGCRRVGILATDATVQMGLYQKECAALGLEGVAPEPEIQKLVMSIIYDEIKKGEKGSREKFTVVDKALRATGCDAGILACTELSVYRVYHGLPDFYVDAMEVLVEQAILVCGKKLRMV